VTTSPNTKPVTSESAANPATHAGLILAVMCTGMFVVLLDVTVINVAVPAIGHEFAATLAGIQWVVTAYTITIASLLLIGGTLGDRIGHRRIVLIGFTIFAGASLACGIAPTIGALIIARSFQGLGAALLLPGTIAIIADAYPNRADQARALGVWSGTSSLALPSGPLLSGILVSSIGWRWIFLLNIPIAIIAVIGIRVAVPTRAQHHRENTHFDVVGVATAAATLTAVIYAVTSSTGRAAALTIAIVAFVAFIIRERHAAHPALPLRLFRHPPFTGANVVAGLMNLATNGTLFLTTLYLQEIHRYSPLAAGVALLPLFIPLAGLAPLAGRLAARYGPRPAILTGALFAGVGEAALMLIGTSTPYIALLPTLLGIGIGTGLVTAPVIATAVAAVSPTRSGLASGVNNTVRQTGTALGVAIFGSIAGSPHASDTFISNAHSLGIAAAAIWAIAFTITAAAVPACWPGR
jgi:MFS transporter, DHA2 family, methylenomycin A resistance protein